MTNILLPTNCLNRRGLPFNQSKTIVYQSTQIVMMMGSYELLTHDGEPLPVDVLRTIPDMESSIV